MQMAPLADDDHRDLVGRNIRYGKHITGVGQLELARRTGISRQQLYEYERGLRLPGVTNLMKIALALGLRIDFFTVRHDEDAAW